MKKFMFITAILLILSLSVLAKDETEIYKFIENDSKMIALTFDDGPHPVYTPEILDILAKHDVKGTFFVVGSNMEAYPEILIQTVEAGHEIGNHTYTHLSASHAKEKALLEEMEMTHDNILRICDYETKIFRPPGGVVSKDLKNAAQKLEYKIILWNIDTKDWAHNSVKNITSNITSNIKSGSIILFHDYIFKNSPTVEALDVIIPKLKEEGYTFVTVSELIECDRAASGKTQY